MKATGTGVVQRERRRDRLVRNAIHDPYRATRKLSDPTACPECDAVFREGRWSWASAPTDAARQLCPACRRIRDDYPAGYVIAKGDFLEARRDEILALARNVEKREKAEHPLKRIMQARIEQHALVITTTDVHLARAMGGAFHAAYRGDLRHHYSEEENLIRVTWSR
jgi:hypothetical protein